jgi:hypothetical protein
LRLVYTTWGEDQLTEDNVGYSSGFEARIGSQEILALLFGSFMTRVVIGISMPIMVFL